MSFEKFDLSAELLHAIRDAGYLHPTPVQSRAIPLVLSGQDVIVTAQTGTGKTAGFTLPLLQRLCKSTLSTQNTKKPIKALVLTPTRELAAQVHESVKTYGKYLPFKSIAIFGGVNINSQIIKLRRDPDILVATPGRLLDLANRNVINLSKIEIFTLDEADRMLDMGFIHDIRKILKLLPKRRQNLLFSATFSKAIKVLADKILSSPKLIEVKNQTTTAERVTQVVYPVDRHRKRELLSFIIGSKNWRQVLVFIRTKHAANRLVTQLEADGLSAAAIHGNKTQAARTRALANFKQGKIRVLVATDVAARGIDIDKLPYVVNFDLPNMPEDYVHRVGRTGRANNDGLAVSLMCVDEKKFVLDIEKLLKRKLRQEVIPGYEPNPEVKAKPIQMKKNSGQRINKSNQDQKRRKKKGYKPTRSAKKIPSGRRRKTRV